ncbi:GAF domain-containing sensor histidine kinase [Mucilaginibacter sp. UR6-1]|uniref:GAF domain-containing sensor histidine kinase n=1 Tax=Mucilaginibacter sp. UR6-1 TaxID=1435643 RepID=UPI001E2E3900|nr:GAF domain-containing sensor histidine kinase [Mucilaginibacter sp. UR6-1]MCC8409857.1 GAF domain-containing sensor histidine kinase [Mucilaginibacter sp. UR6-1]
MNTAQLPANELSRLEALYKTELLDTPQEQEFDDIVRLASDLCNMPISLISLVDANRQWFKARVGLDATETSRDISFCSHAILQDNIFEIPDARQDDRFFDNPLVTHDPSIRYYAGVPLVTSTGSRLGTLCVIDRVPRHLNERQRFALKVLADNVIKVAELRIKNKHLNYLTQTQKRIISILAHDVRNPLASLKSVIEFRNNDLLDEAETSSMMGSISLQLDSTIDMIENVVNWGEMQLKFDKFNYDNIDLSDLVQRIVGSQVLNNRDKGNTLVNAVDKEFIVNTDKRVLEFILRNLMSNANKFTENGTITISAVRDGKQTEIKVTDTGVGMLEGKAEQLFNGTENGTTQGTQNEKGNGLGLLLVKEFVDRMNGSISAHSKQGEGACFKIVL